MGGGLSKAAASHLSDHQLVNDTAQQVAYPHFLFTGSQAAYDGDVDEQEEVQEEEEVLHGASQSFQQQGEVFAAKKNSPVP